MERERWVKVKILDSLLMYEFLQLLNIFVTHSKVFESGKSSVSPLAVSLYFICSSVCNFVYLSNYVSTFLLHFPYHLFPSSNFCQHVNFSLLVNLSNQSACLLLRLFICLSHCTCQFRLSVTLSSYDCFPSSLPILALHFHHVFFFLQSVLC